MHFKTSHCESTTNEYDLPRISITQPTVRHYHVTRHRRSKSLSSKQFYMPNKPLPPNPIKVNINSINSKKNQKKKHLKIFIQIFIQKI